MFVEKYFKKGDGITVIGRMESEKYQDKDGNNRTAWKVTVDDVEFHFGKKGGNNHSDDDGADERFATALNLDDSDIPF